LPNVQDNLMRRVRAAVDAAVDAPVGDLGVWVSPSTQAKFGDYQVNAAMSLGKRLGRKPRELAEQIVAKLDLAGVCEKVEVAGGGFINLSLDGGFLEEQIRGLVRDDRLGVDRVDPAETVVVDYSGPNVAKEMHVGHLRSTIIGDAISRVLEFQGHRVIRQNHLGDWGTQFGMLIQHMHELGVRGGSVSGDLNELYQAAKRRFDAEADFADRARGRVVQLQGGDPETLARWGELVDLSQKHFRGVYSRLDSSLQDTDIRGESFYNPMLGGVLEWLDGAGILKTSEGARVVYPPGFVDREGQPQPMIVRKTDGGYLYATTDLAAARYRVEQVGAGRVVYVTDARQSQHFAMVFAAARMAGLGGGRVRLEHVPFGTVLGEDHKPFKTRSGDVVKLIDLLDEAERRAGEIINSKNPDLPGELRDRIGHVVGVGALKYADLSSDRVRDYVFDWDRMLSFDGNTAPYLQNAYVRIRSIFRKGQVEASSLDAGALRISDPHERALAIHLLRFPVTVDGVGVSLEPHRLCTYLFELATEYHRFYEHCPVLKADDAGVRESRLLLCGLVGRVLERGLGLLGIGVVEQM
jgi:arginyl-tRNA synthetase